MIFFRRTMELHLFFCYSWISLIWHIFPCQFYIFITLDPWLFLKVLNKVKSEYLHKPESLLIIDLLPFAKLLELLAINHSLSERRTIFVSQLLKFVVFWLFYNLHGCALPCSWLDNAIWFSTLPGCQGSCGIVPNGPADLVVSFNIHQGLKC